MGKKIAGLIKSPRESVPNLQILKTEQNGPHFFSWHFKFHLNTKMTFIPDLLNCSPIDAINNDLASDRAVVWPWSGDKQSHKPITAQFADAHIRH